MPKDAELLKEDHGKKRKKKWEDRGPKVKAERAEKEPKGEKAAGKIRPLVLFTSFFCSPCYFPKKTEIKYTRGLKYHKIYLFIQKFKNLFMVSLSVHLFLLLYHDYLFFKRSTNSESYPIYIFNFDLISKLNRTNFYYRRRLRHSTSSR